MQNFLTTENHEAIITALDFQQQKVGNFCPIVIISGEYGTGKTESLNHLSAQEGYYLSTCYKGIAPRALLCRIAESMEIQPAGTINDITGQIIEFWEETKMPLLIDEADFIVKSGTVEVVRNLADEAKAPLVLAGMKKLETSLKAYPHILDRSRPEADLRVHLKPLDKKGLASMAESYSAISWDDGAISFLLARERGRYRGSITALAKVDTVARRNSIELVTEEVLEAIYE